MLVLDTAAAHIVKKAVASSVALAEQPSIDHGDEKPWGGMSTKTVLAAELIPMMIKIQGLTNGKRR